MLASLVQLSDQDVLAEVRNCAHQERGATAQLIAAIAELDARRLYLGEGCSSLFTYCTQILHLSEHEAYGRIEAARSARRFPVILQLLKDGSINLTAVGLLGPHLTLDNHCDVLAAARHKSKRDVEHLVATLSPRADVPALVRKLPTPKTLEKSQAQPVLARPSNRESAVQLGDQSSSGQRRSVTLPIAAERYKVQFTASRETYDKLRRAQDLLRHTIPDGDLAAIFDRALTLLLAELEKRTQGATEHPRVRSVSARSRQVPAAVRRQVWKRDNGRCAFVGAQGRCKETGFLEFHHVNPYTVGGQTSVDNLQLRCRAHNVYEAEQYSVQLSHNA